MTDSEARDQLSEVSKQLDDLYLKMREVDEDIPEHLFHYTDAKGLIGMVTSRRLWASSADFLNDSSEPSYAYKVLETCFEEVVGTLQPESIVAQALGGCWAQIMQTYESEGPHVYVFCFSADGDLLSQWRGYGDGCSGYAVGFSGTKLSDNFKTHGRYHGRYLKKIIYTEEEQRTEARRVFQKIISIVVEAEKKWRAVNESAARFLTNELGKRLMTAISAETTRLRTTFKTRAFKEEREWRIIQFLHPAMEKPEVQFRPGSQALKPYVDLDLGILPIEKVTVGPVLDPVLSRQSLERLFARQKYSNVSIKNSDIPYRL